MSEVTKVENEVNAVEAGVVSTITLDEHKAKVLVETAKSEAKGWMQGWLDKTSREIEYAEQEAATIKGYVSTHLWVPVSVGFFIGWTLAAFVYHYLHTHSLHF